MAGPGDADDRQRLNAELDQRAHDAVTYGLSPPDSLGEAIARVNAFCDSAAPDLIAGFRRQPLPRLVREVVFGEEDFDAMFMARFICRICGPTNRVVGGHEGFVCMVCQQAATYQIMTDCGLVCV